MVLFEAVWLESPASQSGLAKVVEGFGRSPLQRSGPGGSWKRACFFGLWPGLALTALKALGRGPGKPSWRLLERPTCSARKKHEAPPDQMDHALGFEYSYAMAPNECSGGVSTVCELACTGQGGEALPSPLRDPLFLTCARAVSPRPAFGVCRLTAATPHLVWGTQELESRAGFDFFDRAIASRCTGVLSLNSFVCREMPAVPGMIPSQPSFCGGPHTKICRIWGSNLGPLFIEATKYPKHQILVLIYGLGFRENELPAWS